MQRIERQPSLSDIALERVVEAIIRGDLVPGKRLKEAVVARDLGISRGPLREAIGRLEGRNLVVRTPQVGVMIVDPSPTDILDAFLLREALEGVAARLAAERMSNEELTALERLLDAHAEQPDVSAGNGYYQLPGTQDFHFAIIKGSRSARLESILLGELYYFLRIFRFRSSLGQGRSGAAHAEHITVLEALQRRDPVAAEAAMRTHLTHARQSLVDVLAHESAKAPYDKPK
jgi:DNA-binding GntR family transcriptional regulator